MISPLDLERLAVRIEKLIHTSTHGWHPADELDFHQKLPTGYDPRKLPDPGELRVMAHEMRIDPKTHQMPGKYQAWIVTTLALEDHVRDNDPRNPKRLMRDLARGRLPR